jgi:protein-arginine deiminase
MRTKTLLLTSSLLLVPVACDDGATNPIPGDSMGGTDGSDNDDSDGSGGGSGPADTGSDSGDPTGGSGDPTGGSGDPTGDTGDPTGDTGDPTGDTGTTGDTGDTGDTGEPAGWAFDDVFATPNLDDDDGQYMDFQQYEFPGDDDLTTITISADAMMGMAAGDSIRVELTGDTTDIRLWHAGEPAAGSAAPGDVYEFTPTETEETLGIEFGDFNVSGTVIISHLDGSGNVVEEDEITVHSSPLILNHHLQPAEEIWVVSVNGQGYSNQSMVSDFSSALGSAFTSVNGANYGYDVWIQDEFEWATSRGQNGQRLDIVIDSIRDRGLDNYAENALVEPGRIAPTWGTPGTQTSYDSFGNLEASPPVTVGGMTYPFGKVYYGRYQGEGINSTLANFLAQQEVQDPFALDTTWLCVGHVDEFSSFVPDSSSAKGFKFLIADIPAGLAILNSLPSSYQLPLYGADHGYATVGSILSDGSLMALNSDIQSDYLDPIRQQFMTELGLTESDIIRVPSLFENLSGCGAAALIPGMVNLQIAEVNGQTHVFIPDPFFRSVVSQSGDPFINEFTNLMPAGMQLHYVDDWDVYHLGIGEVHCGSNVQRTPTDTWWTSATDLLGGL